MDKPLTMPIKDWLIRRLSVDMMVSERVIHAIINHQYETGRQKMTEVDSIEFSGWGRFTFNRKKAEKKLNYFREIEGAYMKQQEGDISPQKARSLEGKLRILKESISYLENKLKEDENKFS